MLCFQAKDRRRRLAIQQAIASHEGLVVTGESYIRPNAAPLQSKAAEALA